MMKSAAELLKGLGYDANKYTPTVLALVNDLVKHPLYKSVTGLQQARTFMRYQVWCVWDFMCLAKSVQIGVGCYQVPWIPPISTELVQAANGILSGEEADVGPDGLPASHLEIFISSMIEAGADATSVIKFIDEIRAGVPFETAVTDPSIPEAARDFMGTTMRFATGPLHCRVACFCLTREELVPRMFYNFIPNLPRAKREMPKFLWYLQRHVELDMKTHGPHSQTLLRKVIGDDRTKQNEAMAVVVAALEARKLYLDKTLEAILASDTKNLAPNSTSPSKPM
jgi:hypothetical protein